MTRKSVENSREKREKSGKDRTDQRKRRSRKLYAAGAVGLASLLACAFFLPQVMFGLRDAYLCRDIVYEERENTDVTLANVTYEPSLGRRLQKFADGLSMGTNYYVSSQEMAVTEQLYLTLDDRENGISEIFSGDLFLMAMELNLVSSQFWEGFIINRWKQYVIYSENYTEGVNFIIWDLELEANGGEKIELLMDAEDYTLYGIYAEKNTPTTDSHRLISLRNNDLFWFFYLYMNSNVQEFWYVCSYYYQSISSEEMKMAMNKSATMSKNYVYTYEDITSAHLPESVWDGGEAWNSPDTNTLILHLPFVGQNLDFSVRLLGDKDEHTEIEESENDDVAAETYRYPEMYMGIDAICRLIPEFAERF